MAAGETGDRAAVAYNRSEAPDDLLSWSAGENWLYRKEGPLAKHRLMFRFLRFLVIANIKSVAQLTPAAYATKRAK
jgi:hypothetical protein